MTNQASEDKLREVVRDGLANHTGEFVNPWIFRKSYSHEELTDMLDDITASERLFKNLQSFIRTEKLKLLDEVIHQSTINLKSASAVAGWAEIRKKQLGGCNDTYRTR